MASFISLVTIIDLWHSRTRNFPQGPSRMLQTPILGARVQEFDLSGPSNHGNQNVCFGSCQERFNLV
ncbi:hypothetical protein GOP47_0004091 [Adiantum capillus-veneris]|uniref:Uncharacterized protein n=1 Tax=Adiantum capillus-veneris TaxID=13818 RepID=A0A9D4V778_ADICA|nr:hypothetical protein GOP47_0004091 [Adiantum capillus-veneris]